MKRDPVDNLPVVGTTSSSMLGVRPGIDITIDTAGNVVLDATGMSVAPRWQDLDFTRIPKRLHHLVPGATGPNNAACFAMGLGPFRNSEIAPGLRLIVDEGKPPVKHGVFAPHQALPLPQFQTDLENTRSKGRIDET